MGDNIGLYLPHECGSVKPSDIIKTQNYTKMLLKLGQLET
jgi:hypothetical protein